MQRLIKEIAKLYATDEGAAQGFKKFYALRQAEGWSEFVRMMHIIRGLMGTELFSRRHTKLSADEKDVRQRVYSGINELLEFLENPSPELERAMFLAGQDSALNDMMGRQNLKSVPPRR
jgi:hypothetical protein